MVFLFYITIIEGVMKYSILHNINYNTKYNNERNSAFGRYLT